MTSLFDLSAVPGWKLNVLLEQAYYEKSDLAIQKIQEEIAFRQPPVKTALVLFRDGKSSRCQIHVVGGACLAGQPTAYVFRGIEQVWVRPGESVEFVEV